MAWQFKHHPVMLWKMNSFVQTLSGFSIFGNSITFQFPIHNRNDKNQWNHGNSSKRKKQQQYFLSHIISPALSFLLALFLLIVTMAFMKWMDSPNNDHLIHFIHHSFKQLFIIDDSRNITRVAVIHSPLECGNSFNEITSLTKPHWIEMIMDSALHWFMIHMNNDPFNTKSLLFQPCSIHRTY